MARSTKLRKGTCKNCGKTFRRPTAGELIKAIHAHYVKAHPAALSRRIKKGMRKNGGSSHNPAWFKSIMAGVFPPAVLPSVVADYRAMDIAERTLLKNVVRALTVPIGAEASAVAELALRALDKAV